MDVLYTVNVGSQELRWGPQSGGSLPNAISLGFSCFQVAVMPDQRHLYITGYKHSPPDPINLRHAWLSVVDTCTNAVTKEVDLGIGHAGQCAVPAGINDSLAFVAISQAVGDAQSDTGPHGGSNRIEILDVANVATPVLLPPAVNILGTRFGTLHVVWSNGTGLVYTSHRGDGHIFAFPSNRSSPAQQILQNIGQQPTGLALDNLGLTLYVGRRLAGDIYSYDLATSQPSQRAIFPLPNGASQSAIYMVVDRFNRILATSHRPNDGSLYIIDPSQPQPVQQVNAQGTLLGKPAVTPDGSRAYVPRGGQNDVAQIDLASNQLVPGFIAAGTIPSDILAVSHAAGQVLEATPDNLTMACHEPQRVTVRAFDACQIEQQGQTITATVSSSAVSVNPQSQVSRGQFVVECIHGGLNSVTFMTTGFPQVSIALPVMCQCPTRQCVDFSSLPQGSLPPPPGSVSLAGFAQVSVTQQGTGGGPSVGNARLLMRKGAVRFRLNPGTTVANLAVRYKRRDPFGPLEEVAVSHAGGTDHLNAGPPMLVGTPPNQYRQDTFTISCIFQGITEWLILGGAETEILEMCFDANFNID